MQLEGFVPYEDKTAELYAARGWWLNITLGDMLDRACERYPDKEALVGPGKRYTYSELRDLVDTMAFGLLEQGLQPGDRALLQLPNWPEFVISYFALQKAGLVMVLLTVNHTAREIAHLANLTQPKAWILPETYRKIAYAPLIEQVRSDVPDLKSVIVVNGKAGEGSLDFDDFLKPGPDAERMHAVLRNAKPDPRDVCQILPSGGTTGLPKGAPRTHNDYLCNIEYKARAWEMSADDRCLVVSTVGHNLALLVCVAGPVFCGATVVMEDSTYPQDFCRAVQDESVTCTGLVPTLMSRIVTYDKLGDYNLSSLKKAYVGAANSPPELVKAVETKIGCRYINAFGMVEGPCAQTRPTDPLVMRCETIGKPVCPYDQFVTLDSDGNPTAAGIEGEMAAKGPGVFTGYYRNPQANRDAFTPDGYFRTGDLAVIDRQGVIRITGRIKDIIIRGGENIAARDVEELISSHPKVEYVAAVGMPDPDLGEEVCAYVKPVTGASLSYDDIIEHMKSAGASKAFLPKRIEFVDDIPLTAAGKADKKVLKKEIEEKLNHESDPNQ
jgi:2,3-dihydroxybenzoate-AMP ligase/mycobactin salicyl-AMP ligase